ncbi:MAG TPA: AEC family transporter, partial [Vicinamibacteria bacterium]|jgi:hypothetical protein
VGNFGLALIQFRLGEEALAPATLYFVVVLLTSFVVCVGVAASTKGGGLAAIGSVLRTPAIVVAGPAALVSWSGIELPLFVTRSAGLLGAAMIPTMLFALGLQLVKTPAASFRPNADFVAVSAVRLVLAPAIAAALAAPFGIAGIERAAGILQSGMPAAVLVSIIAIEYDVAPGFATGAVFFSTLVSLPTLTVLLALV